MVRRTMLKRTEVETFLKEYCTENGLDFNKARKQMCVFGQDIAMLCVCNPDAPEPDGLRNDIETRMLPTLVVRKNTDGSMYAEKTNFTDRYLE